MVCKKLPRWIPIYRVRGKLKGHFDLMEAVSLRFVKKRCIAQIFARQYGNSETIRKLCLQFIRLDCSYFSFAFYFERSPIKIDL